MSLEAKVSSLHVILVLISFAPLQGVTVKPVRCPTNKIAPHKRSPYVGQYGTGGARTLGAFYDLLSPGGPGGAQLDQSGLQERPQEDDPDDCGDIEDYDETDLSSLNQPYTYQVNQPYNYNNRFFFGGLFRPGQVSSTPPPRPTYKPSAAPPYWSGGYFSNNHYRPPVQQEPSDYVKPVHEGALENHSTYRPDIVGGPLGHVVGHRPVHATTRPDYTTTKRLHHQTRYPPRPTPDPTFTRPATHRPRMFNNDGILGSFIDLLLFR
ncbi:uncharacterized protein LOC125242329 [Leguminivora glycinivorella]|uniref:uncharacterized protein LOC125242329 n=1 Tax=Leguminivora glycinivorella TaxID=1035111 RepID=UPI0020107733|nr:uncharacterized protein LOC125242329 [Leguminivora glycinivorella]